MAWSDAARAAALAARRAHARGMLYRPTPGSVHLTRKEMAAHIKDMRRSARAHGEILRGYEAARVSTGHAFRGAKMHTHVKGASFADQGLHGVAFRKAGSPRAPRWAARVTKFTKGR